MFVAWAAVWWGLASPAGQPSVQKTEVLFFGTYTTGTYDNWRLSEAALEAARNEWGRYAVGTWSNYRENIEYREWVSYCWWHLYRAQSEVFGVQNGDCHDDWEYGDALYHLAELRALLGPESYYSGRMPFPLPTQ